MVTVTTMSRSLQQALSALFSRKLSWGVGWRIGSGAAVLCLTTLSATVVDAQPQIVRVPQIVRQPQTRLAQAPPVITPVTIQPVIQPVPQQVTAPIVPTVGAHITLDSKAVQAAIVAKVRAAYNRQERPMVIFDIDGTLLDNRARTLHILQEYGRNELTNVRPKVAQLLATLSVTQIEYRLRDTLDKLGVKETAVVNNSTVYWAQHFFNDEYLPYDVPTPGAVNFVRTLYSSGARIVYLSGRDAPRQLLGTVKALRDNGYPIGIQGTELILKPTMQTQDAVYKQRVTNYLRHYGKVIAAFDNEPANVNVYRRAFANAEVVLFEASHSPNPPPVIANIKKIAKF